MAAQADRAATASSKGDETANGAGDPTLERVRDALLAAGAGDFSVRLPGRRKGAAGEASVRSTPLSSATRSSPPSWRAWAASSAATAA